MLRIVAPVLTAAFACGGSATPSPSPTQPREAAQVTPIESDSAPAQPDKLDPIQEALESQREFNARLCACKDRPCADALIAELKAAKEHYKARWSNDELRPTSRDRAEMKELTDAWHKCLADVATRSP